MLRAARLFGAIGLTQACVLLMPFFTGCGGGGNSLPPAISVTIVGGSSQSITAGQSVTTTAAVENDSSGRGVTWALSGPGTLSKQTSTTVEYDAPAIVSSTATTAASVTATSVADPSKSAPDTVTIHPPPQPAGLMVVSGPSPFPAGCAANQNPSERNFTNGEVEPYVAVNPANPNNIIGVWQQDRWDQQGSAAGILTGVTHDGGKTWSRTFAHSSLCSGGTSTNGGDYERASDPWVSIGPDGIAYQITISGDRSSARRAVLVSRSTDGGDTWSEASTLVFDNTSSVSEDKTPPMSCPPWEAWELITPSRTRSWPQTS